MAAPAMRLERADRVIDLQFRAWLCVWRILKRMKTSWRRVRPDMAEGCPEQFNLEFLIYTATFPWAPRRRALAKLAHFERRLVRLRSPTDVRRFLASLDPSG